MTKRSRFGGDQNVPAAWMAVDGLDLSIRPGEVFALLGQNGAARPPPIGCCPACCGPRRGRGPAGGQYRGAARRRESQISVSPRRRRWRPNCRCGRTCG